MINYGLDGEQAEAIEYAIGSLALRMIQLRKEIEVIEKSGIPAPDIPINLRKAEIVNIIKYSAELQKLLTP